MKFKRRDREKAKKTIEGIKNKGPNKETNIMHVCGTHESSIVRFGIREVLPDDINLIEGPGCPVCITPASEIDAAIEIAEKEDTILTTFGDMYDVPGSEFQLSDFEDVKVIYSIDEAERLAEKSDKEIVHFAIGFETTAPLTANEVLETPDNLSIIPSHRLIPPAMRFLLEAEPKIDGFIAPGHVSTIIGTEPYLPLAEKYQKPIIVGGFEPLDILESVLLILKQLNNENLGVENQYKRVVRKKGNELAQKRMREVFKTEDSNWRGIGKIKDSALKLKKRYKHLNALKKFDIELKEGINIKGECKCGKIMMGLAEPDDCPYFGKECIPDSPVGPCMVSREGACYIHHTY